WSSSFLPGAHQGTAVDTTDLKVDRMIADVGRPGMTRARQRRELDFLQSLNRLHEVERGSSAELEAQIRSMEVAFRMQAEASEAFDIEREPKTIREMYGETNFGLSCLLARRLAERG